MDGFEFFSIFLIDEIERGRRMHVRRSLRDAQDPLSLPDRTFMRQFRISKNLFSFLVEELKPVLLNKGVVRISPQARILVALRFYATGKYQKSLADDIFVSVSQASVSRCIHQVSKAINELLFPKYIKFPTVEEEQSEGQTKFFEKYGFPNVIGVIDSTCIALKSIEAQHPNFINSKGVHSLKVQMVTDSSLKILGICSDSPGGTEDSAMWYKNEIREILSLHQNHNSWLLGDGNFPLEPWLLTPFKNPDENEKVFNKKHYAARECMRKCKRTIRSRFRCLDNELKLSYAPGQVSQIIDACAVLHNLCIIKNVPFHLTESVDEDSDDSDSEANDNGEQIDENINSIINDMASFTRQRVLKDFLSTTL
ncbi:putative nuclease HARBI1 [Parasteatoda tepidariorum]|uniref:putative nuclease HARBI1 n=1 Tax=Parasteatoda tepidariorum TaxID=114398 RepID=UPI00077FD397|nr:putative nuclease HARBI1 [Parasteatoda tepidariorum]XP_015905961.1 putative nuclease HARBI1 [Parasteatoda tepidariorum]XP_042903106.1 putative nuclease HARBI1 [Parasteatoda tepidariorum]